MQILPSLRNSGFSHNEAIHHPCHCEPSVAIHTQSSLRDLTKSSRGNIFSVSSVFDFGLPRSLCSLAMTNKFVILKRSEVSQAKYTTPKTPAKNTNPTEKSQKQAPRKNPKTPPKISPLPAKATADFEI